MKRRYVLLILLLVCLLIGTLIFCHNFKEGKKILAGDKLTDGVYLYNLDIKEDYYNIYNRW